MFLGLAGFAGLGAIYIDLTWNEHVADLGGDNAYYLFIASTYSPWGPADSVDPVAAYFAGHNPYPPMYPLLLGLTGGGKSIVIAHIVTAMALLGALAVGFVWLRDAGISPARAYAAIVLVAIAPASLLHILFVHSESLYMLLSLAALALCTRAAKRPSLVAWWASALLVAGAVLTRSIGVALLGAFVVHVLIHRPRQYPWLLLAAVGPLVIWKLAGPAGHPGYLSNLGAFYVDDWTAALIAQSVREIEVLWYGWVANWQEFGGANRVVVSLLAALSLLGALYRTWRRQPDGIYVLLYLGIVIAWPYPAEARRLEWPVMVLLLGQALLLIAVALPCIARTRVIPRARVIAFGHWGLLLAVAISVTPGAVFTLLRLGDEPPDDLAPYRRTTQWLRHPPLAALYHTASFKVLVEAANELRQHVPRGECVLATKPSIIGWHANRITKGPPPTDASDEAFWRGIEDRGCQYVYTMGFGTPTYARPHYPYERVQAHADVLRAWTLVRGEQRTVSSILLRLRDPPP